MSEKISENGDAMTAEFDALADEYYDQHKANIAMSGEGPEYFAEYKISCLANSLTAHGISAAHILDFGTGIGNSIPWFRKHLGDAQLTCADVSSRSLETSKARFPGAETYVLVGERLPLPDASQDVIFSACVFHHIPHEQHHFWFKELLRVTRPGGLMAIFEHNPYNPLTVRAVNTCPLDANAHLIRPGKLRQQAINAGWIEARIDFRLFFPGSLRAFRVMEPSLAWMPIGAQYQMTARRP